VDRAALKVWLAEAPENLARLEAAVHPLVAADRAAFLDRAGASGADVVLLDVPLLFETGGDAACDATVVVSVPPEVQRARVLARPGMTAEAYAQLLARQMPDAEKRRRADHVIDTRTMGGAQAAVRALLAQIREQMRRDHDA
jgi:dephospho-CoA kinase